MNLPLGKKSLPTRFSRTELLPLLCNLRIIMVNTQCYLIKAFSNIKDTLLKVFHTQSIKIQLFFKAALNTCRGG